MSLRVHDGLCKPLVLTVICCASLAVSGCKRSPAETGQAAGTYRSERHGFSIRFPADWQVQENIGGALVVAVAPSETTPPARVEVLRVAIKQEPAQEAAGQGTRLLRAFLPGVTPLEEGQIERGDRTAPFAVYTRGVGGQSLSAVTYLLLKPGEAYLVTGLATPDRFEAYRPGFRLIAQSFRKR